MRRRVFVRLLTAGVSCAFLLAALAGCQLAPTPHPTARSVAASRTPTSLLTLIVGSRSAQGHAALRDAVLGTARMGERLLVLNGTGRELGYFAAPAPPTLPGPAFPTSLPADATSFQRAAHDKSLATARATLRRDQGLLQRRARQALRAWADGAVAAAWSTGGRFSAQPPSLQRAVAAAVADIATLQQAGLRFGDRNALAIIDVGAVAPSPVPIDAAADGMTVVLSGVPDSASDAAWQADLLQAGASRVYVLPDVADDLLPGLISAALDGRDGIRFSVTRLTYGPAQYAVPPSAAPALESLLRLLTVTYPDASASINGYTDTVPVPGGNQALSWRRANAVLQWLVGHGVAADRLDAVGHGSADPVAPNTPAGQPLNRRVEVIVWPA
jgi:outer membrane protein OmpA-like peptidoglycan-associated protein